MNSTEHMPKRAGLIAGAIMAGLVLAGGITILVLRPVTDLTSLYIAVAAVILSPVFLLVAYLINKRRE
jgi:hypothetical protein